MKLIPQIHGNQAVTAGLIMGPGFTYDSETWWDGTGEALPTGQGGFGVSRFFFVYRPGQTPQMSKTANPSNSMALPPACSSSHMRVRS